MGSNLGILPTELRRVQLRSRKLVTGDLLGQYRSAFRGTGLVYSDLREYQPGDDVKHIHWKATARTGVAFVKSYDEERQLRVLLAVDISSSMLASLGFQSSAKALEFCSLVGSLTQRGNDLLGLFLFADQPISLLPPKAGPKRFSRVLSTLLSEPPRGTNTNMAAALRHLNLTVRKPSIIFLVSDFACPSFEDALAPLAARHDVVLVQLQPPASALPRAGIVSFRDAESGSIVDLDTSSRAVQAALGKALEGERTRLKDLAERFGAGHIVISDSSAQPLIQLMRERVRRVAR